MSPQSPKTRNQLLECIAVLIGWGATAADVQPIVEKMEVYLGLSIVPTASLPHDYVNPYAKKE